MALRIPRNAKSICRINIFEEATQDNLCTYLSQGRAVLNGIEAKNLKLHLKYNVKHQIALILVQLDKLERRDVIHITRMFCKTVEDMEYTPGSLKIDECIQIMKNVRDFQNLTGGVANELLMITDERSTIVKSIVENSEAWNSAIRSAEEVRGDCRKFAVLVDEHLCKQYYHNKDISQSVNCKPAPSSMDDTLKSGLLDQRPRPLSSDEELMNFIANSKRNITTCRTLSEDLITCTISTRAKVAEELEQSYDTLRNSISNVTEALTSIKSQAMDEITDFQRKQETATTNEMGQVLKRMEELEKENECFKKKIMNLVMGISWDQSSFLINAQRRPNEKIMSYFVRLESIYSFCIGNTETDWNNENWYAKLVYQKILDTLPIGAKAKFQRDCKASMTDGSLVFSKLKLKVINIALGSTTFKQKEHELSVPEGPQVTNGKLEEDATGGSAGRLLSVSSKRETRTCYYCKKPGHLAKNCFKKKRDNKNAKKSQHVRETKKKNYGSQDRDGEQN